MFADCALQRVSFKKKSVTLTSSICSQARASALVLYLSMRSSERESCSEEPTASQSLMKDLNFRHHTSFAVSCYPPTMFPAFLIIRLETSDQLEPTVRRSEAVRSSTLSVISIPDPNYTWTSTQPISPPNDPSTQISFNVGIDKRDGNAIYFCKAYADRWDAIKGLFELATNTMLVARNTEEELEFTTVFKSRSMEASACLRRSSPSRLITWQIVQVDV